MRKIKLVCYDVNGTLLDDTIVFWNAINGIFPIFGKERLSPEELKEKFGQPWTKIYREQGIPEEMADDAALYELYNNLYSKQVPPPIFPDLKPTLEWLRSNDVLLGIISTQQDDITLPLLKHNGLEKLFCYIDGGVSDKAQALKEICDFLGVPAEKTAYVGDQASDILHAKKAGCVSIAFSGGLNTAEWLAKSEPDFLIKNHWEIKKLPIF